MIEQLLFTTLTPTADVAAPAVDGADRGDGFAGLLQSLQAGAGREALPDRAVVQQLRQPGTSLSSRNNALSGVPDAPRAAGAGGKVLPPLGKESPILPQLLPADSDAAAGIDSGLPRPRIGGQDAEPSLILQTPASGIGDEQPVDPTPVPVGVSGDAIPETLTPQKAASTAEKGAVTVEEGALQRDVLAPESESIRAVADRSARAATEAPPASPVLPAVNVERLDRSARLTEAAADPLESVQPRKTGPHWSIDRSPAPARIETTAAREPQQQIDSRLQDSSGRHSESRQPILPAEGGRVMAASIAASTASAVAPETSSQFLPPAMQQLLAPGTRTPLPTQPSPGNPVALPDMTVTPQAVGWGDQLQGRLQLASRQGVELAELQLHPAELGKLEIQISTDNERANIVFYAQNRLARELIEAELPRLRELFQDAGIELGQSDVSEQSLRERSREPDARHGLNAPGNAPVADEGESVTAENHRVLESPVTSLIDYYV